MSNGNSEWQMLDGDVTPEAVLEAVIEMSDDAIFICDIGERVTRWSAAAERLFGRSSDHMIDRPFDVLFSFHVRNEVGAAVAAVVAGDRIRHFETEIQRPDGMPLPVTLSMCPVLDTRSVPVGAVVIARDITEQRLAQATMAELDARMEEGEALAHIGSWLWDLRTGAVQWSSEFHRIHGVEPLDFGGTLESYLELIHPSDRGPVETAMLESVRTGRPFEGEYRVTGPDQPVRVVHFRAQATFGSTGKVVGLRGTGHEITEPVPSTVNPVRPDA